jgi:hypothetical protein
MSTQRSSVIEWSGSGTVMEKGSLKTVFASRKLTPCLASLISAFSSFHSKSSDTLLWTSLLYNSSLPEFLLDGDCGGKAIAWTDSLQALIKIECHVSSDDCKVHL